MMADTRITKCVGNGTFVTKVTFKRNKTKIWVLNRDTVRLDLTNHVIMPQVSYFKRKKKEYILVQKELLALEYIISSLACKDMWCLLAMFTYNYWKYLGYFTASLLRGRSIGSKWSGIVMYFFYLDFKWYIYPSQKGVIELVLYKYAS